MRGRARSPLQRAPPPTSHRAALATHRAALPAGVGVDPGENLRVSRASARVQSSRPGPQTLIPELPERGVTEDRDPSTLYAALDEPTPEEYAALQQRSTAFNYSHDPRDLWPGAALRGIQSAATSIRDVVRRILDGSRAELVADGFTARELGIA